MATEATGTSAVVRSAFIVALVVGGTPGVAASLPGHHGALTTQMLPHPPPPQDACLWRPGEEGTLGLCQPHLEELRDEPAPTEGHPTRRWSWTGRWSKPPRVREHPGRRHLCLRECRHACVALRLRLGFALAQCGVGTL